MLWTSEILRDLSLKWVSDGYPILRSTSGHLQYIPRNMHTVFALLCFVVVIHWLIFPYPAGLLHWHCGNLTIAPVPAKHPWWIWINTSCEFIMNDCITTTKQSTTKPCAYFGGYRVLHTLDVVADNSLTGHFRLARPHWNNMARLSCHAKYPNRLQMYGWVICFEINCTWKQMSHRVMFAYRWWSEI